MHADTYYNLSFSGSVNGTGTMDLNPTADTITVTLTNTTNLDGSSPSSDANLIAGLIFTLSTTPSSSATLASQSGSLVDISNSGTQVPVSGSPTHWGASSTGAVVCLETAGKGSPDCAAPAQPEDLIITNESAYNVNASVTNHEPSILGAGTFVINVPGLTTDSRVLSSDVSVAFGTSGKTEDVTVTPGNPPAAAPEPASLFLVGSGLLGAAGALRRRMRA
jgi:hypothetical protein